MTTTTQIFITGVTGHIGSTVLEKILQHPAASGFEITALVRDTDKAAKLQDASTAVKVLSGSLADTDKLVSAASEADIVINFASGLDFGPIKAVLSGLKTRYETTKIAPSLIFTSGTAFFGDKSAGTFVEVPATVDTELKAYPTTSFIGAMAQQLDDIFHTADAEGYVKIYTILPSAVYGIASGKFADVVGTQNRLSMIARLWINTSIQRGSVPVVGQGKNTMEHVHVDDLGDLYYLIFDAVVTGKAIGHGTNGYYIGENGRFTAIEYAQAVANALVDAGVLKTSEVVPFSQDELASNFMLPLWGTNSNTVGSRARSIGWKPTRTTKDFLASVRDDVEYALKMNQPKA